MRRLAVWFQSWPRVTICKPSPLIEAVFRPSWGCSHMSCRGWPMTAGRDRWVHCGLAQRLVLASPSAGAFRRFLFSTIWKPTCWRRCSSPIRRRFHCGLAGVRRAYAAGRGAGPGLPHPRGDAHMQRARHSTREPSCWGCRILVHSARGASREVRTAAADGRQNGSISVSSALKTALSPPGPGQGWKCRSLSP